MTEHCTQFFYKNYFIEITYKNSWYIAKIKDERYADGRRHLPQTSIERTKEKALFEAKKMVNKTIKIGRQKLKLIEEQEQEQNHDN